MTTKDIVFPKDIDLKTCTFYKPELSGGFRKSYIKINGNHENGFILQTPRLTLRNVYDNTAELLVSRNKESSRKFYNIVSHLEDMLITNSVQNSKAWFGKELTKEQIESTFKSCIKMSS